MMLASIQNSKDIAEIKEQLNPAQRSVSSMFSFSDVKMMYDWAVLLTPSSSIPFRYALQDEEAEKLLTMKRVHLN